MNDISFEGLKRRLQGDLYFNDSDKILYATDASVYREVPLAVARPKNVDDIKEIINFARFNDLTIVPRAAGTSLAGQVVGGGIVIDISKYLNKIIEVNENEKWVRLEPGVVLDELNIHLKKYGLFFAPETSTSNRCCLGGMFGNNSCGSHSIIYGSTREHVLEAKAILSDSSEVEFRPLKRYEFREKMELTTLEGDLYRNIYEILTSEENIIEINENYPEQSIKRRNTGYALDILSEMLPFNPDGELFNFCKLLAGSEGTLAFITEIKLNLVPLPPKESAVICAHFTNLTEAFNANLIALKHKPGAIELIDKAILDCTKENLGQKKNRFFIEGDPAAILVIEFARETKEEILSIYEALVKDLNEANMGYHFPILYGEDINKVWSLRKAGLGLLSNIPGDKKPVAVIEDTAVNPEKLPEYMAEIKLIFDKYKLDTVYYAHIATGEIHIRPVLDLKAAADVETFRNLAYDVANLVKKYNGSLSGEHGDGRLRGEFIELMLGEKVYELLRLVKNVWDPDNIFNPYKIIDTPRMNTSLRYETRIEKKIIDTIFDFSSSGGYLESVEKCNGSADCRKSALIGGIMCPTYMATLDENMTTRARANIIREYITKSKENIFNSKEIYDILDNCISCKGCKLECPSNVDMAKIKAEYLQHYYDLNGLPIRTRLISMINYFNKLGSMFPLVYNFMLTNKLSSSLFKKIVGFEVKRQMPILYKHNFHKWLSKNENKNNNGKKVCLYIDEFTEFNDVVIGIKTYELLIKLGYNVIVSDYRESGRVHLSKGLVNAAKEIAFNNINYYSSFIENNIPIVGIEPSCILSFRDEYPDLMKGKMKTKADLLAANSFLIDEFIATEFENGNIKKESFTDKKNNILYHGHCHQKTLAGTNCTKTMLTIPENYVVEEIKSGCCGMAGSFGYEKEHYDLSMKIGETVLFPKVREAENDIVIAASGTSCRHHIADGTGKKAYHPIEILYEAIK